MIIREGTKMATVYKVKNCFLLKRIAGEYIVIARGNKALEFNGTLVLNESCAVVWEKLKSFVSITEIASELVSVFGIEYEIACRDVEACIDKMACFDLLDIKEQV